MKTWNIIIKYSHEDTFDVTCPATESKLIIHTKIPPEVDNKVNSDVYAKLESTKLVPSKEVFDLLNLAIGVYTADQSISRDLNGYYNWSRHLRLFIPVHSTAKWNSAKVDIEKMLSYLSGDAWEITFREDLVSQPDRVHSNNPNNITEVSLFSGGLDSYIGAIDLLESKKKVAFVSHYKNGVSEHPVQTILINLLKEHYKTGVFSNYQFYVQPNQKGNEEQKENSSRARSFLFITLGLSVANSLGDNIPLIIPENGLISLNIPLTNSRLSSHSTRTTHPYFLELFHEVLNKLNIPNQLFNPYQLSTKGEMMLNCQNQALLKSTFSKTMSCAHPDAARWAGESPNTHCGYCTPCIIRQAAIKASGNIETSYIYSDIINNPPGRTTRSGSDIRAFKLAIEKLKNKSEDLLIFHILKSGPIPIKNKNSLKNYIDLYKRGMNEVASFFGAKIW